MTYFQFVFACETTLRVERSTYLECTGTPRYPDELTRQPRGTTSASRVVQERHHAVNASRKRDRSSFDEVPSLWRSNPYKDGEKTFDVSPNVTVVTFAAATEADLKPGEKVFSAAAQKLPDGTILASNISVGRNGINPPM
jgi:hypothetical protein